MKESDAKVDYDNHQLLLYVEKDNGDYGPLQTGSFLTRNYVDDFWQKQNNLQKDCLKRLCKGEISPVGYYMVLVNISAADLASRIGISASKVLKHQKPEHFSKIGLPLLAKYSEVFGVPVANMFQVLIQDENGTIQQKKTENPMVVLTGNIEEI